MKEKGFMPYTNIWEEDGLYRTFTEEINGDEILKSNIELHAEPNFEKVRYIIDDFTEVTGHSVEAHHIKAYAVTDEIISKSKGKLKIAIVVTQPAFIELANDYCELMEGTMFDSKVFSSLADARVWVSAS